MKANTLQTEQDARLRRLREGQPIHSGNPSRRVRKRRRRHVKLGIMVVTGLGSGTYQKCVKGTTIRRHTCRVVSSTAEELTEDERRYGRIVPGRYGGWRREGT